MLDELQRSNLLVCSPRSNMQRGSISGGSQAQDKEVVRLIQTANEEYAMVNVGGSAMQSHRRGGGSQGSLNVCIRYPTTLSDAASHDHLLHKGKRSAAPLSGRTSGYPHFIALRKINTCNCSARQLQSCYNQKGLYLPIRKNSHSINPVTIVLYKKLKNW